ncbi:MAG: hypothetical protein JW934_21575 [Anaerolineae bacterium]|nr:hypothetical protein [Anaerolineae bacterium]
MVTLVAQIAPQRSTQYAALASTLAPHELRLCVLGQQIANLELVTLGGQDFIRFDLPDEPTPQQAEELGALAMTSAFFIYYDKLGRIGGPLLRPIETGFEPALPPDLVTARRYRGKTNELFTHFMCNVARASSALRDRPWRSLRVFDPLAGGGTTLFTALMLGADVAGVESDAQDVESTVAFVKQYMREQNLPCKVRDERFKGVGKRWTFKLGSSEPKQCILAQGDTKDSAQLITGFRPHLIVADLPYGIQHKGQLADLLTSALPVWASILPLGGAMALAWESKRFGRAEMIDLVQGSAPLTVLNDPPYDALAHRVDRVIKERDLVVARLNEALAKERDRA